MWLIDLGSLLARSLKSALALQVIQGVHDQVDFDESGEWPKGTPYKSQLVLIGRHLPKAKEKITQDFMRCSM